MPSKKEKPCTAATEQSAKEIKDQVQDTAEGEKMQAPNSAPERTISPYELNGVAMLLDDVRYIVQEMNDNFFEEFDPETEEGRFCIQWEFKRNRAKAHIVFELLWQMETQLAELGIVR